MTGLIPEPRNIKLASAPAARALDEEASRSWGLNSFALVEAAGRGCAQSFTGAFSAFFKNLDFKGRPPLRVTAVSGSGNNGADAMVLLRALIFRGLVRADLSAAVINRIPREDEYNPRSEVCRSLAVLGVPSFVWEGEREAAARDILARADIIIDGIAGTGIRGPLGGNAAEMVRFINALKRTEGSPFILAIDVPSGASDDWEWGSPILRADATAVIEPPKAMLYTPAIRPFGGTLLPVEEIFPRPLLDSLDGPELLDWDRVRFRIGGIKKDDYKQKRGTLEIRAGSPGFSGAARIAARGAQAAGAGLVRLLVDDELYPILASQTWGVMAAPLSLWGAAMQGDALVLGPGWGKGADRTGMLQKAWEQESAGVPLILDADAIPLARERVYHGRAIFTPHPGECAVLAGLPKEEILARPLPVLARLAREKQATVLFKSHVFFIAAPDGRTGVIDGMTPVLAAGGSGDLLAGICGALAARMVQAGEFDGYTCAVTAAALLAETGRQAQAAGKFTDPAELADGIARIAGAAWL
ncbi:MAG: bifunctional ADP-dependent NAD(P)H-hydrate dehydratase/NAD(P)H-hydrate epimerase [Treponema sp.]|jgi:NAD(P)H-hydrate epimerase|nr:bifunctional ADP-dependent NAD(P)H-hydrate dehydratase/NAD(P)H-hydrate epimerase [Treponema sp.]